MRQTDHVQVGDAEVRGSETQQPLLHAPEKCEAKIVEGGGGDGARPVERAGQVAVEVAAIAARAGRGVGTRRVAVLVIERIAAEDQILGAEPVVDADVELLIVRADGDEALIILGRARPVRIGVELDRLHAGRNQAA